MRRRYFIAGFSGAIAAPLAARAQRAERVRRLGFLVPGSEKDPVWNARFARTIDRLRELGWLDGHNLAIHWRFAGGNFDVFPRLIAELIEDKAEIILVNSAGVAAIAVKVTNTIPIVVASAGDLEGSGLVASLRRPGRNVTGMQVLNPELMSKRIDLLRQWVPDLRRLGLIEPITPTGIITEHYIQVSTETANALGIAVHRVPVHRPEEFGPAFAAMVQAGDRAAVVIANPLSVSNRSEVIRAAAQNSLPTIYEGRAFVASGGLVSYGATDVELYRGAADFIDQVLKGADPAGLPIRQPTKFELVLNLKTAKVLGLTVPQLLLTQADEVIE